jgi:hypothetical protein
MKSVFVGQNSKKFILYKMKQSSFAFLRPYYTNSIFFITYNQCMHKRLFVGRRKRLYVAVAFVGGSTANANAFSERLVHVFFVSVSSCLVLLLTLD